MIRKILITSLLALLTTTSLMAQSEDNGPKKKQFTLSTNLGFNGFAYVNAPQQGATNYSVAAPNSNWFNNRLTTAIEAKYFVSNSVALTLTGGLGFSFAPGYNAIPGTFDNENNDLNDIVIPSYNAVPKSYGVNYNIGFGFSKYKNLGVKNLYLTLGATVGFAYAQQTTNAAEEFAMGRSVGEAYSLRTAFNMGIEYFFLPGMYLGMEVSPISYIYNVVCIRPEDGLTSHSSDSHNIGILSAPTLKIGFKF